MRRVLSVRRPREPAVEMGNMGMEDRHSGVVMHVRGTGSRAVTLPDVRWVNQPLMVGAASEKYDY